MPALSGAFRKRVLGLFLIGLGVLALSAPLHHAAIRQGRSAATDHGQRVSVQGRPIVSDCNDAAAGICRRARNAAAQRFFNLLFGDVVRKDFLPEDRAAGCEREYIQLSRAFETLDRPSY
jgi:hypothetical protein